MIIQVGEYNVKNITNYAVKKSYTAQGQDVIMIHGEPGIYQVAFNIKYI